MRALFLDAYGTLFHYERERLLPVFISIARGQGLALEGRTLLDRWERHEADFRRRRVQRTDGHWESAQPFISYQEAWTACFRDAFADLHVAGDPRAAVALLVEDIGRREVYPEVPAALAALRARVPVGLLTNADSAFLFDTLDRSGLRFDMVVYSEEVQVYKPHPRIFEVALERAGAPPDEVLYAGDSPAEDMVGAAAAGIPAVWVNRRLEGWPLVEPRPAFEVGDLLGLVDVLATRIGVVY
ncbi:MAG: HAD family hydrolase [Chloroflexi bacterium]|nr:HAD family hydrolase [Chloroflexota bacterium]